MDPHPRPEESFEETYPRYAFAELVRLAVALGLRIAAWRLIPLLIDQHSWAQSRVPMDMIFQGWSMRLFQA